MIACPLTLAVLRVRDLSYKKFHFTHLPLDKRRSFGTTDSSMDVVHDSSSIASSSRVPAYEYAEPPATTPSLVSDNERENETSVDEFPPSTPPNMGQNTHIPQERHPSTSRPPDYDVINVDLDDNDLAPPPTLRRHDFNASQKRQLPTPPPPPSRPRSSSDAFSKRAPSSPMPAPSPRKPRPPARNSFTNSARSIRTDRTDDRDPLTLSNGVASSTTEHMRVQPTTNGKRNTKQKHQSQSQQRSLHDELLTAREDEDLESGYYSGVGTRSKRRGYHAHGGAGGPPVFMGVGYVDGAIDHDSHEEDEELDDGLDDGLDSDGLDSDYQPNPQPASSKKKGPSLSKSKKGSKR